MPKKKKDSYKTAEEQLADPANSSNGVGVQFVSTDISPLDLDFGRADLNQLRDKLNEVILKGNK